MAESNQRGGLQDASSDVSKNDQFLDVFKAELEEIRARRSESSAQEDFDKLADLVDGTAGPNVRRGLVGLALSGGGIRSATFNLGVIQALAQCGILKHVDYLSTVSGGGYIGSCMSSIFNGGSAGVVADTEEGPGPAGSQVPEGAGDKEAAAENHPKASLDGTDASFPFFHGPAKAELSPLRHLRNYSNYLAPKGLAEFVQLPALLLRGIVINMSVILPWIILSSFLAVAWRGRMIAGAGSVLEFYVATPFALGLSALAAVLSLVVGGSSLRDRNRLRRMWTVVLLVPLLLFAAESLTLLTHLLIRVFGSEVDIWTHVRTLAGALAAILPIVLAGKAAERVSGIGGKLGILVLGLLGPVVLIAIHAQIARSLIAYSSLSSDPGAGVASIIQSWMAPVPATLAIAGVGLGLWNLAFFNANKTSLLSLYRDRLSRAYLFTWRPGEDPVDDGDLNDDQSLSKLRSHGPYHIVNTTMNLQSSDDLSLRGRDAQNFVLTKRYCGSSLTGYMPTDKLEGLDPNLDLGTAMAISAAAASPNMGMTTIGPLVLLMTLLNVRLGYWMANPRVWLAMTNSERAATGKWRPGAIYLIREMLLGPNGLREFVSLTDGGHLENTGIYELLRRECQLIIACDAEADPNHNFSSLARVIRFASIDWGIRIDIDLTDLALNHEGVSMKSWAIGRVTYPSGRIGYLLYIKASRMGDESEAIQTYQRRNPDFPHQSTGDQFFDEAQFESYRALGYEVVSRLIEYVPPSRSRRVNRRAELSRWVEDLEAPLRPRGELEQELNNLQDELNALEKRFEDPSVYEYSKQIYPEFELNCSGDPTPTDYYKIFWLCIHQLNFMENVFVRVHLDKKHQRDHHFNRGWMNLFRRWAKSQLFVEAWTIAIGDYSVSFERFCRDVLRIDRDMELDAPEVAPVSQSEFAAMEAQMSDDLQDILREFNAREERKHGDGKTLRVAYAKVSPAGVAGKAITTRFPIGFVVIEDSVVQFYAVSERYRGMYYLHEIFRQLKGEVKGVELSRIQGSARAAARHFFERLEIRTFEN